MSLAKFKGIFPPVPTIVDKHGDLDKKGMANLLDHLINNEADGVLILGSGGEFCHMPPKLRFEVAEFAVKHIKQRIPVMIGISSPSTKETIEYGQHAAQIGADAVLVVNPYYALLNSEAIYHHYKTVAENINIPILLYNFPALTGQDIGIDVITRLAKDVPNIIGLKDTIDNISHTREVINQVHAFRPDFIIFSGFDEYMLDTLILGGHGGIPATFNFAPKITKGIYKAFKQKDYETAFTLQRQLAKLMPIYAIETPFFAVIKQAIKLTGIDISNEVLAPVKKLPNNKQDLLVELLKSAQIPIINK
ncbi:MULTISPECIES: dihydrodipicolinate synthase family protein [unclassified Gilliamella]|uniref:dihydrodipicolinate synthase family protein n=1 Tax=unclassified Gilliamella TaxID=2685620 RepID=UPI00226A896C|nr:MULTISPECIES: dihydrodipicolinate synthase family protein [unclassified Gilliamella]MCX8601821.1 dihydrodipicolinate synthase family protein [Gilliamella sp. B3722]MCX8607961.1 dihydrodipicolinate synthase family protein [Gilliamella sp. B3771]MCX8611104.1 dihydrodipicolinate synthase family protein [Gilliamella sp. B3891]MCX8613555.1 dihydrodipicolinate synthase family protein [Gilliamella sp. B3773]MCX8614433.1 dihydrodipicolinate synthase family protein [Gilliamella sp. B3770]